MNPPSQQVFLGNQQHPPAAPRLYVNPTTPDEKLWGSNVRRSMGIRQIICGGIEFVFGIVVIGVHSYFLFDHWDYVGWGIWTGLFAIVTGSLGVLSQKKRCMVIAYMVTSIITAVLCAGCFVYAIFGARISHFILQYGGGAANLALYIILCIVFFIHMVISIIGARYTCGALSSATNQSQQVVNYTPQPLHQQYVPPPPYTVAAAQSGITFQTSTPSTHGVWGHR
ncbi:hypothetical protein HOLleu_35799 [Holothuria leucospilota]|uniref:Uncharacterized protein n=1 Tax=Holothuria leucospilota TaxID=206669 RepID=A0A9Q1BFM1_HOLLE|nr:hypothetical protein HOLleu_35799 [Holothuria leucospilota]